MPVTFEPYQARAISILATKRRALVNAPTASGKTIISAGALAEVIGLKERQHPVLIGWLCNTEDQAIQAQAAIDAFPIIREKAEVKIRCAAAQTDWSDRDVLVVDECHNAAYAITWITQIKTCRGAIWGFSATIALDGDRVAAAALLDLFGGELIKIERSEVQHRLAKARVILLDAFDDGLGQKIDDLIETRMKSGARWSKLPQHQLLQMVSWQVIRKHGIHLNKLRNAAIIELAKHHAQNHVLILVNTIAHGKDLEKKIPHAKFCTASAGKTVRRQLIQDFKDGRLACLIATSLADEGLDAPICDVIVIASGGRSSTKAEQRSGRALRAYPGKTHALIYEFKDAAQTTMAKHSEMRLATYRKLGYEISGELALNFI